MGAVEVIQKDCQMKRLRRWIMWLKWIWTGEPPYPWEQ